MAVFPLCIQLLPSCPGGDVSQKSETEAPENAPALLILHSWIKPAHPDLPPSSERPWGIRGWRLAAQSSPLHPVFDAIPESKKLAAGRNQVSLTPCVFLYASTDCLSTQRCYDWIEFTEFPLGLSSEQPLHLLVEVLQLGCNRVGRAVDLSLPLVAYLRSQLKPLERLRSHKLSRQWSEEAEYACISPNQCLAAEAFSDGSVRISEFQWEYPTTRPLGDEDLTWTVEHFIPSAWAPWNSEDAALVASINRDRGQCEQGLARHEWND